jgi:hypothetical protein
MHLDGKAISLVEGEDITAQMSNAGPVRVIQIEGNEKQPVLAVCLDDELFFLMNLDDPVGVPKDVGSDAQLEARSGKGASHYSVT